MSAQLNLEFGELYARSVRRNELDKVESDLVQLALLFKTNFDFRGFIRSTQVPIEDRVQQVVSLTGFSVAQTFIELLFVILSEGYFNQIQQISDKLTGMISERTGRYLVVLTTSFSLEEMSLTEVQGRLSSVLSQPVVLRNDVDSTLIAGSVLRLPDGKVYDFSIKRQLSEFKSYLMEKT